MAQNKYETVFIVTPELDEEAAKALSEKFQKQIAESGTIAEVTDWGKRRLAYPINDLEEGYYTLVNYTAPADFVAELERKFKIDENILRFMTVREEE
ncbi:MAG: 30S ribosomal protein S6 [Clostridia bacterium]|nr:30S ribosomal protein S6 [Clostridia bacterium]